MNYGKTQDGNPHKLVINQHIFPAKSISRFYNHKKNVDVKNLRTNATFYAKAENPIFCAKRAWNQKAETRVMKDIEDKFQIVADHISSTLLTSITEYEKEIINEFFALWNIRFYYNAQDIQDYAINGATGLSKCYTLDEQEQLEKAGISVIRPDFTISSRDVTSVQIFRNLMEVKKTLSDSLWGILYAKEGEFIVPDNCSNGRYIPLTPTICLLAHSENGVIDKEGVKEINIKAIESSKYYYFANDLCKCPGYEFCTL
ncbi:MAG: hypothetical protein Q8M39_03060 [Sulfuricurvum sp.]|nr:hypothetical protein [Sulfuricurvum sp.]